MLACQRGVDETILVSDASGVLDWLAPVTAACCIACLLTASVYSA